MDEKWHNSFKVIKFNLYSVKKTKNSVWPCHKISFIFNWQCVKKLRQSYHKIYLSWANFGWSFQIWNSDWNSNYMNRDWEISISLCWIKVVENRRNLIIALWKLKQHQTKTKIYPKTNFVACHYIFSSNPKLQHKFWNNLEQLWEDKKWKKWDQLLFVIYFDVWCNSFNFFHISEGPAASQSC